MGESTVLGPIWLPRAVVGGYNRRVKCFVTGASGFVGANLVHKLNAHGHEVRALLREGSDQRGREGAEFEAVRGDLTDRATLEHGMGGCDWCFHVAASSHLWLPDSAPM